MSARPAPLRSRLVQACLLAGIAFGLAAAAGAEKTVSFAYTFDAPQFATKGAYTRLSWPGCDTLDRIGEPAMPFRTARLLLPPGYTVGEAQAQPLAAPERLAGQWRVEYARDPHCRPAGRKDSPPLDPNLRLYASAALYPRAAAELISVQRLGGYDIALVRVFPIQFQPAEGALFFSKQIRLDLKLKPLPPEAEAPLRSPHAQVAREQVAALIDNSAQLATAAEITFAATNGAPRFDYLLLTTSNLVAAFQPLVERKQQDGLAVKVATLEVVTNTFSGGDACEQIRNYIRHAYTNWGISYVLLGGNTSVLPCRYAHVPLELVALKDRYVPADLYYACLDGSWNANGDRHWGEPNDGENGGDVDLLAEVCVGRAPVGSVAQAEIFVEKTIRYEKESGALPPKALLLATYLGDFPGGPCQGREIYQPLLPFLTPWKVTWLDDQNQKQPQWNANDALAAMNQSPRLVLYNGHGNADIQMRMRSSDLRKLTNQCPFVVCSVGCNAAEFDHGKFWFDSFGETLINGGKHGAVAAILNARAGWFDPRYPWRYSGEFQARFFEAFSQREPHTLGRVFQQSRQTLLGQVETDGAMFYRWCYYTLSLLGDPHLPLPALPPEQFGGAIAPPA